MLYNVIKHERRAIKGAYLRYVRVIRQLTVVVYRLCENLLLAFVCTIVAFRKPHDIFDAMKEFV